MDNSDLALVVAEMLIEIQHLKERVALLENTFSEVRDDLHAIRDDVRDTHGEIVGQGHRLDEMLTKVRAVLAEQRPRPAAGAPAGPEAPGAPEPPAG